MGSKYFLMQAIIFWGVFLMSVMVEKKLVSLTTAGSVFICVCSWEINLSALKSLLQATSALFIMKTRLFKYIENFITKNWKFSDKNSDIFHISVQNIDCGYSLEPPRRGGSNEYPQYMFLSRNMKNNVYPFKRQFYYIKVEFKVVKIIKACFRDGKCQLYWGQMCVVQPRNHPTLN